MSSVAGDRPHITVCICTYRRPALLARLLHELQYQDTEELFTFSIVVTDNDPEESASRVVRDCAERSQLPIEYYIQRQQSIALTRNAAIRHAKGEFVAFIDDDEFPARDWLATLFKALQYYDVDGVLGPVKRYFDEKPPGWVVKGHFYDRETYPTGTVIDWRRGRTGNVLLRRNIFKLNERPFRPEFRQGEDQEFFYRHIKAGRRFIWCNEAVAYEIVPPIRWKRGFMIRRALLRGAMEPLTPTFGGRDILKSLIAVPSYVALLPFTLFVGHHRFMSVLVSLFDHIGKLLATIGVSPIKEPYVTH